MGRSRVVIFEPENFGLKFSSGPKKLSNISILRAYMVICGISLLWNGIIMDWTLPAKLKGHEKGHFAMPKSDPKRIEQ